MQKSIKAKHFILQFAIISNLMFFRVDSLFSETHYIRTDDEFTVVKAEIIPSEITVNDGESAGPFKIKIEPNTITAQAYQWDFEAPAGAGNDPFCEFNQKNAESTTIKRAKWFALPDSACGCSSTSTYKIKCEITINGEKINATYSKLNVQVPEPTARTDMPKFLLGWPETGYDLNGDWKVIGLGTISRPPIPDTTFFIGRNSYFYQKVSEHEKQHRRDWENGFDGHILFSETEFYNMISNLTAPTPQELSDKIREQYILYVDEENIEVASTKSCFEYRAYQVSDSIPPLYLNQNCGRFSCP